MRCQNKLVFVQTLDFIDGHELTHTHMIIKGKERYRGYK